MRPILLTLTPKYMALEQQLSPTDSYLAPPTMEWGDADLHEKVNPYVGTLNGTTLERTKTHGRSAGVLAAAGLAMGIMGSTPANAQTPDPDPLVVTTVELEPVDKDKAILESISPALKNVKFVEYLRKQGEFDVDRLLTCVNSNCQNTTNRIGTFEAMRILELYKRWLNRGYYAKLAAKKALDEQEEKDFRDGINNYLEGIKKLLESIDGKLDPEAMEAIAKDITDIGNSLKDENAEPYLKSIKELLDKMEKSGGAQDPKLLLGASAYGSMGIHNPYTEAAGTVPPASTSVELDFGVKIPNDSSGETGFVARASVGASGLFGADEHGNKVAIAAPVARTVFGWDTGIVTPEAGARFNVTEFNGKTDVYASLQLGVSVELARQVNLIINQLIPLNGENSPEIWSQWQTELGLSFPFTN